ncbi:MAG: hypothetical protein WC070_03500 [Candidatus Magasanikbacteria bacterium]
MSNKLQNFFLAILFILVLVLTFWLVTVLIWNNILVKNLENKNDANSNLEDVVACTMDAKMCPDGSYVARVAPDCEFEACPEEETNIDKDSGFLPEDNTTFENQNMMNWYENKPLSFDNLDWQEITRSDGVKFIAPIHAPFFNWSPEVKISKGKLNCPISDIPSNSPAPHFVEKNIGDKKYCLYVYGEGAAGTSYSSSLYITEVEEGLLVEIPVVVSHTNCGVYGDEDIEKCEIGQKSWNNFMEANLDNFINKIINSIEIPNNIKADFPEYNIQEFIINNF